MKKAEKLLTVSALALIAMLTVYILAKFLFPCLLPFIAAYLTAATVENPVAYLSRKYSIRRSFCSALCVSILLLMMTGIISLLTTGAVYEITEISKTLPSRLEKYVRSIGGAEDSILMFISAAPDGYRSFLMDIFRSFTQKLSQIPGAISGKIPEMLSSAASTAPKVFLFLITYIIAVFTISADKEDIRRFFVSHMPDKAKPYIKMIREDALAAAAGWLRSQLILMTITFIELAVLFYSIRIEYPALIAALIAVLDALPVFGTGTALIPWAIISFLGGSTDTALSLIVIYFVTVISRRLLEPHIVSSQLGINAVSSLFAMYAGFRLSGIVGMMLYPVFLVLAVRIYGSVKKVSGDL